MEWNLIVERLVLASFFGALIGFERERKHRAAGIRTHMLVGLGSSLAMIVSAFGFSDILGTAFVKLDPSRIAAQVISGIGFIGVGTILLLRQGTIRGLTTAAGLWTVAGIGLATGGGMYLAATATTLIALIILWVLHPIEQLYPKKSKENKLKITTTKKIKNNDLINKILLTNKLSISSFVVEEKGEGFIFQISLEKTLNVNQIKKLLDELKAYSEIKEISWIK